MKRIICLVVLILLPCWLFGATYYVTQNGEGTMDGSDHETNPMSVAILNAHILADDLLAPGDTVYLCDYWSSPIYLRSLAGTLGNNIVFRGDLAGHPGHFRAAAFPAYHLGSPSYISIINQELEYTGTSTSTLCSGINANHTPYTSANILVSYVNIHGFRDAVYIYGSDWEVSYCEIWNNRISGIRGDTSSDGIFHHNYIHDNGTSGSNGDAISLSGRAGTCDAYDNLIINQYGKGGACYIDGYSVAPNKVTYNVYNNVCLKTPGFKWTTKSTPGAAGYDDLYGIAIGGGTADSEISVYNNYVAGATFSYVGRYGGNVYLYNNTFVHPDTYAAYESIYPVFFTGGNTTVASVFTVKNNIFQGGVCYFGTFNANSGANTIDSDYNDFSFTITQLASQWIKYGLTGTTYHSLLEWQGHGFDVNAITDDPSLTGYIPAMASLTVDSGTDDVDTVVTDDLRGVARPVVAYDMGAYEIEAAEVADVTNPAVAITAPADPSDVFSGSCEISGTASDDVEVLFVTYRVGTGPERVCTGTTTWNRNITGLVLGANTVTVTAYDTSMNTSTDTIVLNYTYPYYYYVSQAGSGDGSGSTFANQMAFATFNTQIAAGLFQPGQDIYIIDTITITTDYLQLEGLAGTVDGIITIRGDYLLHPGKILSTGTTTRGIRVNNNRYLRIYALELEGAGSNTGYGISGYNTGVNDNLVFDTLKVHKWQYGMYLSDTNIEVVNCEVYNNSQSGIQAQNTDGVLVHHNNIHDNGDIDINENSDGLYVGGSSYDVHGNTITNQEGSDGAALIDASIPLTGPYCWGRICDNILTNDPTTSRITAGGVNGTALYGIAPGGGVGSIYEIYNNYIYGCYDAMVLRSSGSFYVYNNTIVNAIPAGETYWLLPNMISNSSTALSNVYLKNNIFSGDAYRTLYFSTIGGGSIDSDYNCFDETVISGGAFAYMDTIPTSKATWQTVYDANSFTADPLLTGYTIPINSPCKDKGTTLAQVTTDIRGVARPVGSAYDVGAYEYEAAPAAAIKLYLTNSSGAGLVQANPNASLGGYRSRTQLSTTSMKNLFDDVTVSESILGDVEYRMIDVYNAGSVDMKKVQLFMKTPTSSPGTELDFGYSATAQPHIDSWNGEVLINESTAPAAPAFTFANRTRGSPLSLGTIPAGQSVRVGIRRTVNALTSSTTSDLGVIGFRWISE